MEATFSIDPTEIIQVSAKTGQGVNAILHAIIDRIPAPVDDIRAPFSALLFDSSCVQFITSRLTRVEGLHTYA